MDEVFDSLLSLEETYYAEGYEEGLRDGEKVGLVEGCLFGFEKGFDKFLELGRLQGRVSVWKARIPLPDMESLQDQSISTTQPIINPRLIKQICQLESIISSPPTANDADSVEEAEEIMRKGRAKMKIVHNLVGEKEQTASGSGKSPPESSIEEGFSRKT